MISKQGGKTLAIVLTVVLCIPLVDENTMEFAYVIALE